MEKATALLATLPPLKMDISKLKSTEATIAASCVVGTVTAVQLFTDWDPVGRCLTFWRQLQAHVSTIHTVYR